MRTDPLKYSFYCHVRRRCDEECGSASDMYTRKVEMKLYVHKVEAAMSIENKVTSQFDNSYKVCKLSYSFKVTNNPTPQTT